MLAIIPAIAAPPTDTASAAEAFRQLGAQTLTVSDAAGVTVTRDAYTATPLSDSITSTASNYDWAKLVLFSAGWPQSTENVTVLVRWMRQENGPPNWFNRNNPLNNGFGSGGGGGTGTYANLVISAQMAAANLKRPIFATIAKAFAAGDSTTATEHAIWASAWSTSHYADGTHWSDAPVPEVASPAGHW
jgi:hypothetical protein